jgi:hypothetical protein
LDERKLEDSNLKRLCVDRVVDSSTHRFSQDKIFGKIQDLDSDDDILEVVQVTKTVKLPPRVTKHQDLLRLAQDQAKKRRKEDQDYLAYRIAEQKRKKQLRKEAKLAKEAQERNQLETNTLKKLVKVIILFFNSRKELMVLQMIQQMVRISKC